MPVTESVNRQQYQEMFRNWRNCNGTVCSSHLQEYPVPLPVYGYWQANRKLALFDFARQA